MVECSRVIHPPRWRNDCVSRGGRQVLFSYSDGFLFRCNGHGCFGACASRVGARILSQRVFTFCCSPLLVLFPGSYDPQVFPARSGFPGIYFSYARINRYTHRRSGRELGGGTCWLSYLTPMSTRCPRVVGTNFFPETVARTLLKRRFIALPGRSRTPRRSKAPLASGQRGDGHGSTRLLRFFAGREWSEDYSCELPLR